MKRKIRVLVWALVTTISISTLCSCITDKTERSDEYNSVTVREAEEGANGNIDPQSAITENVKEEDDRILTERQKKILRDLGLPEEYDALNEKQKSGIISIETMLRYLEETYGGTYCYNGYTPYAGFDPECLTAYREDDPGRRLITVSRYYQNGEFTYSDNYLEVVSEDAYRKALEEYFDPILGSDAYWISVELYDITDSDEYIIKRATGQVDIYIRNSFESEEEVEEIVDQYSEWIVSLDCEYPTGARFIVQSEKDYNETNMYNYTTQLSDGAYVYYIRCSIQGNGDVVIYRR